MANSALTDIRLVLLVSISLLTAHALEGLDDATSHEVPNIDWLHRMTYIPASVIQSWLWRFAEDNSGRYISIPLFLSRIAAAKSVVQHASS